MSDSSKKRQIITLCSSASFYKEVIQIEQSLKKLGFKVLVPLTATKMKRSGNFDVQAYKTWFKNENDYKQKTKLMRHHFKKVGEADAILVINLEKNGINGYIGGNTLMEMALAFHLKKKIFLYNSIPRDTFFTEEIRGMNPVVINRTLEKVKF